MFIVKNVEEIVYPNRPGLFVHQAILVIILLDTVVWIIIWDNWICLLMIENARALHIPKVPGLRAPQTILITMFWGFGGLDCHFGELELFVYHGKYGGN